MTAILIWCCKWATQIFILSSDWWTHVEYLVVILKIDQAEKRGYGEIGIENWWHLIGLNRTHNRDSARREKERLVERVIRCLVWWNSLFISFTLLGIPNVHLELSQQELVLKWESLLKNPLTESELLKNNHFTDSSHLVVCGLWGQCHGMN